MNQNTLPPGHWLEHESVLSYLNRVAGKLRVGYMIKTMINPITINGVNYIAESDILDIVGYSVLKDIQANVITYFIN